MAHQLQHRHYARSSLESPAAAASFLDHTANHTPGRAALQELNADDLQNAWHKSPHNSTVTPFSKQTLSRYGAGGEVATPESLADDLFNFHIHSPESDGSPSLERARTTAVLRSSIGAGNTSRPPTYSSVALSSPGAAERQHALFQQENRTHLASPELHRTKQLIAASGPGLAKSSAASLMPLSESDVEQAIKRQETNQFDWVISLPCEGGSLSKHRSLRRISSLASVADSASQGRKLYFGCNLVHQRSRSGSDLASQHRALHSYTLIATPLGAGLGEESQQCLAKGTAIAVHPDAVADGAAMVSDTLLAPDGVLSTSRKAFSIQNADSPKLDRNRSVSRSPSSSVSRIEDTIEELDRLEDQFEAVNSLVSVGRVPSPDKPTGTKSGPNPSTAVRATPGQTAPARKPVANTTRPAVAPVKATRAPRVSLGARPASSISRAAEQSAEKTANAATSNYSSNANKQPGMTRPSCLQPPKPTVKSRKPLTVSTFELPGEAVARRLKEQREARIAAAAAAAAAAAPTQAKITNKPANKAAAYIGTPGRTVRAAKSLPIPTFELPGEAISRRKREEHEARLKQQEEEERKQREFKARPIRVSATPAKYPRDTITSRARQRISLVGGQLATDAGSKRLSTVSMASTDRSPRQQLAVARGRGASIGSPSHTAHVSRAPSTSTGSISGKKSTVSTDEVHLQKLRGKNIYNRDKLLAADRDREKHEREAATKQARQEAAERSRALSREWAEKQKRRNSKMVTATSPGE